jgi:ligand-binding sensor domain-containing protein/DNA-binding CsgD family transcriptional regulator
MPVMAPTSFSRSVGRLLAACVLGSWVLPAAAMDLTFRPVGENRGLDANMPVDLLMDRRGFLWVGSREGLFRYDGYQATLFKPDAEDPASITDLDIRALYEDSDGIIWVATNTGGLNRFDPASGNFTAFRHRPDDPTTISHDSVYGIAEGSNGDLWMGTQIGLSRLDRDTGLFTRYLNDPKDPRSLSGDYVFAVLRDRQDVLWIATIGGGLNRYNAASDDFSMFDLAAMSGGSAHENDVFALAEDADQNLWVGTRSGLLRLDPGRVRADRIDLAEPNGSQPVITELKIDRDGNLWLGTISRGVIHIDSTTLEWTAYTDYNKSEVGGLAAQPQLSLLVHDDLLFVGTWGAGLWATRVPDTEFSLYGEAAQPRGLRFQTVTAVMAGESPGRPVVGSFGGGVQPLDVESGTYRVLGEEPAEIAAAGVMFLARSRDGQLFAATTDGLLELGGDGRLIRSHTYRPDQEDGLGEGYVTRLLPDDDGGMWVGVGGSGLYKLDIATSTFDAYRHDSSDDGSLSGDYITSLLDAGSDRLWVGTRSNGLNLCRKSPWDCQRIGSDPDTPLRLGHYHVTQVYRDSRSRVWVATDGGGLHQVVMDATGAISDMRRWTEQDGLISDGIMAIEEDADGSLWLSTRHGLSRLDTNQGRVTNYIAQTGLPATHFNAHAAARDEKYIYFGSAEGVLVIPRGRPFVAREPAVTRITSIEKLGTTRIRPSSGWVPEVYNADHRDVLAVNFAALDYAEVPHDYEFRLQQDGEWTPLGHRSEVTFLNLAPGRYQFTARGRDVFGLWSTSEPLEIQIIPPFWMSTWFRLLVLAALLGAIFMAHKLRTARLKKRAIEIERLAALREQALEEALGAESELSGLTPRQKEVLQLIAEGCSTRDIAERLSLSVKTVETHRARLMERLEIFDVPGLVRLAIRARLISPHD